MNQNVSVLEDRLHPLRIGYKIRRQISAVELHSLDHVKLSFQRLRLFHRDDAILPNLLHRLGNNPPNRFVIICTYRADLGDHFAGDGLGEFIQLAFVALAFFVDLAANELDCFFDAALERHRIGAGCDGLDAFAINRLRENGGGGGAIAGDIGGLAGDFADHLRAHVLERVFEFDFFGYGHAVFGNRR